MKTIRLFVLLVVLFVSGPTCVSAQATELETNEFFVLGKPTMTVYAFGTTARQGIWTFNQDITFLELLTALQPEGLSNAQIGIRQRANLLVYRTNAAGRQLVYKANLQKVLRGEDEPPTIEHNDLLVFENIQRRSLWTFRNVSQAVGTASSLILLFFRLRDL